MESPHLEQLYDQHATALYRFLLSTTRSPEDARDLLQDVFVRISRNPSSIAKADCVQSYLFKTAWNAYIDLTRSRQASEKRQARFARTQPEIYLSSHDPDTETFRNALNQAMDALPGSQRAVVHLRVWEERTFEQIGAALDISPNTAASRYRYALTKLRNQLGQLYTEL